MAMGSNLTSKKSKAVSRALRYDVSAYSQREGYIRKRDPSGTVICPPAYPFCRLLGGGAFLWARFPCIVMNVINKRATKERSAVEGVAHSISSHQKKLDGSRV